MAEIKQTIVTDNEQTKREMRALVTEIEKLRGEHRRLHEESKQHHESFMGDAQERIGEFAAELAAIASVEKAWEWLRDAAKEYANEVREAGKARRKFETGQTGKLVDLGLIKQRPEFNALLNSSGLVRDQAQAALTGLLQGQAKPGAALDRGEADAVFNAAKLFTGDQQAQHDVGMMAGRLKTFDPSMTAGQRADMAVALRQATPFAPTEMLNPAAMRGARELAGTGAFSNTQALGFEAAAVNMELSPRVAATLAAALDKQQSETKHKRGERLTADDAAEAAYFRETDKSKRLDMLYGDRKLAQKIGGGQVDEALRLVSRKDIDEMSARLGGSGGLVSSTLHGRGMDTQNMETAAAAAKELSLKEHEVEGRALENVEGHIERALNQSGASAVRRARFRTEYAVQSALAATLTPGDDPAAQARHAAEAAARGNGQLMGYFGPHLKQSAADERVMRTDAGLTEKASDKLLEASQNLNRVTEKIGGKATSTAAQNARAVNGK